MLLLPLHAQTPSPPRCARMGQGQPQASQAAPGSHLPWHSASGIMNPTGSGRDLQNKRQNIQHVLTINILFRAIMALKLQFAHDGGLWALGHNVFKESVT